MNIVDYHLKLEEEVDCLINQRQLLRINQDEILGKLRSTRKNSLSSEERDQLTSQEEDLRFQLGLINARIEEIIDEIKFLNFLLKRRKRISLPIPKVQSFH